MLIKDNYFNQSIEIGFSKTENKNHEKFIKDYDNYKNVYNIEIHQN